MPDVELPRGVRWSLRAAAALVLVNAAWLAVGLVHVWTVPLLGWVALPVATLLAGQACLRAAGQSTTDTTTRRFWRSLTLACGLFTAGTVANAVDAARSGASAQRVGPVTLTLYLSVFAVILWALLRLPSWQRSPSDWIRFGLDSCMVLVTVAVVVWHFALRTHDQWAAQTGMAWSMLAFVVLAFVSMATFVKVAFAGAGRLDRRALQALALGSGASPVLGTLAPYLASRPYLSTSLVAAPVAAFSIHLAAVRQLRADGRTTAPPVRPRRVSLVPYLAVALTSGLLLASGTDDPAETTVLQAAAVTLTAAVVVRQILALRDNNRLLSLVEYQATHDSLTGAANRALLEQHLGGLLAEDRPFCLVLLDVDDFKTVNDRLGHSVGDALLKLVTVRLTAAVGNRGLVARLGGDEFAIAVPPAHADGIEPLLETVLAAMGEPADLAGQTIVPATSVGVAANRADDDPEELLRRADVAMYAAKDAGGNRRHWFDPALDRAADETAALSGDLRSALANGQIFTVYQPIVDLETGCTVGGEILMRWRHPQRGLVPPDVFIPLAERNGSIVELGHWVLEQVCRQACAWQDRFGERAPARIGVNISARQLAEPAFVGRVEEILRTTGVDACRLVLEVTETAVLTTDDAVEQLHRLKKLGLRIALDDFGTGHSSLSLLLDCPVDVLKVDKSFVSGATAEGAGAIITKNLMGFVHDFGLEAVAEGVETLPQAARLRATGYRLAQGHLYGQPMDAPEFEARFAAFGSPTTPSSPAARS